MTATAAINRIAAIDKLINVGRKAKNRSNENSLFELRGWYQLIRDNAENRYAQKECAAAVTKITKLEQALSVNQACNLVAALRESFNWHPSQSKPEGLVILTRAQHHIACRLAGIEASHA